MFVFFPSEYNTSEAFCLPKKYHIHTQKLVYIQSGGSALLQHLMLLGVFAIATNTCHLQSNLAKLWLGVGYLSVTKQHGDD